LPAFEVPLAWGEFGWRSRLGQCLCELHDLAVGRAVSIGQLVLLHRRCALLGSGLARAGPAAACRSDTVESVLELLSAGMTVDVVLADYPDLWL
jgi:hypothetical protein